MAFRKILKMAVAAAAAWAVSVMPAAALPTFTTGSFALGLTTDTTANLATANTNFHVVGNVFPDTFLCLLLNSGNGCYTVSARTGDFALVSNPGVLDVTAAGDIIDFSTASSLNWSDAGLGSFNATSTSLFDLNTTGSGPTQQTSVTWLVFGNFTIGSAFDNAGQIFTGIETWTINQTGGGGKSISANGSYFSTAPTRVPEPASLAILGSALLAAGASFRRKAKKQDA